MASQYQHLSRVILSYPNKFKHSTSTDPTLLSVKHIIFFLGSVVILFAEVMVEQWPVEHLFCLCLGDKGISAGH